MNPSAVGMFVRIALGVLNTLEKTSMMSFVQSNYGEQVRSFADIFGLACFGSSTFKINIIGDCTKDQVCRIHNSTRFGQALSPALQRLASPFLCYIVAISWPLIWLVAQLVILSFRISSRAPCAIAVGNCIALLHCID